MSQLLFASLEGVVNEETFLAFVEALAADRIAAGRMPVTADGHQGEWANQSIDSFLDASRSWAEDSGFGSRPGPKPQNPWRLFASFLWAGRGYE
jgi:hypothetical protein